MNTLQHAQARKACAKKLLALLAAIGPLAAFAQQAAPTADESITLSEFQVTTSADKGYRAGNSVSATRIDTPIKDLPFAVNAFTSQFISDIGARDGARGPRPSA